MRRSWTMVLGLILCLLPVGAAQAETNFSDVAPGSWYEDVVLEMTVEGVLAGYPDGSFRPDAAISGAEFVAIVARCQDLAPLPGQCDHWAAETVQAALAAGYLDWDELPPTGERFDQPIERQIAVKVLMKAFLPDARGDYLTESQKLSDFDQLSGRYYDTVLAAYATGIVVGEPDRRFLPRDGLTRAEACALISRARQLAASTDAPETPAPTPSLPSDQDGLPPGQDDLPETSVQGGVSQNGWLQVRHGQLCNEAGTPIVLRGMSSHGLQWYGHYASAQAIRNTASFGAKVFRIAMYTGEGGYLSQPEAMRQQAFSAIDAAIANDMYVIIDWHILSDGNPMTHVGEATAFFSDLARRYQDEPALIYEICNEPNGAVTWQGEVRPYAEQVIAAIRAQSPKSIILVGSSTWSQDLHLVAQSPLCESNILYTLHFYAGTHGAELRQRIDQAQAAGLGVFVSEWGTSRADGSGGVYLNEAAQWLDFLEERKISWCNWSLCDKNETSAALKPGTPATRTWTTDDLTASGRFVFSRFAAAD